MGDQYQEITDRIVKALEAGASGASWVKPWRSLGISGLPRNGATNREYRGINVWLLALSGYGDARWYTFNQVKDMGGSGLKGEKGTRIVFFRFFERTNADGELVKSCVTRFYTVFNHAQTNLPVDSAPLADIDPSERYANALRTLGALDVRVTHGGDRAYYSPVTDAITLPNPGQFTSPEAYLATYAHEASHATSAASRCGRELGKRFGDRQYAIEELIAELSSTFLCSKMGVPSDMDNHVCYLQSWIDALKADRTAILTVAKLAQASADYILGASGVDEGEEEEAA